MNRTVKRFYYWYRSDSDGLNGEFLFQIFFVLQHEIDHARCIWNRCAYVSSMSEFFNFSAFLSFQLQTERMHIAHVSFDSASLNFAQFRQENCISAVIVQILWAWTRMMHSETTHIHTGDVRPCREYEFEFTHGIVRTHTNDWKWSNRRKTFFYNMRLWMWQIYVFAIAFDVPRRSTCIFLQLFAVSFVILNSYRVFNIITRVG